MLKEFIRQLKLLVIFIHSLIYRFGKYVKFWYSGKHEFERICELPYDIYEKTMQLDRWLMNSRCPRIRQFFDNNLNYLSNRLSESTEGTIERILAEYRLSEAGNLSERTEDDGQFHIEDRGCSSPKLEDGDGILVYLLNDLTDEFLNLMLRSKKVKLNKDKEGTLRDIVYRIVSFNLSLILAMRLASIRYDSNVPSHRGKLISLWNNLIIADRERSLSQHESRAFPGGRVANPITPDESIISSRWSLIGFQGEDPGTDFRGMGILGLEQLEYLSRKSKYLGRDLLKRSLNEKYEYPFAITGINITYNLVNLYKDGTMRHLYFDYGDSLFRNKRRNLNLIKTLNDLYVELYLRFDCFWRESKPENILVFNELMEEFINIIRMDMSTRNFSLKFIY